MRWPCLILILLGLSLAGCLRQPRSSGYLFLFPENGRWGYLDSTGRVVIKPRFWAAQPFEAGQAAVRENGLYGYIDTKGKYVLPPVYEYATGFTAAGRAVVWNGGQPYLIDRQGQGLTRPGAYRELKWMKDEADSVIFVRALGGHQQGLLDLDGHLLLDTLYDRIETLDSDHLLAERYTQLRVRSSPYDPADTSTYVAQGESRLALADLRGKLLVPLGQYHPEEDSVADDPNETPLAADTAWASLSSFENGRAWAKDRRGGWYLVTQAGRRLNQRPWREVITELTPDILGPAFDDGVEVVQVDSTGLQLIDSLGQAVGPVRRLNVVFEADGLERVGHLVTFRQAYQPAVGYAYSRMGFWDLRTGVVVPPRFDVLGKDFYRGLLPGTINRRLTYINPAGRQVWTQDSARPPLARLNLDYQRRSTYTVLSAAVNLQHYPPRSWRLGYNPPKPLPGAPATAGQLQVSVTPQPTDTLYGERYAAHRAYISNATADTIIFDAQDNRLYLLVQARDAQGRWQDIEYYPNSWCGNSYHTLQLPPGHYWELAVPAYTGSQPTQLRLKLTSRTDRRQPAFREWYSNEFAGSVNPGQFWRRPNYQPVDIMDSYRE